MGTRPLQWSASPPGVAVTKLKPAQLSEKTSSPTSVFFAINIKQDWSKKDWICSNAHIADNFNIFTDTHTNLKGKVNSLHLKCPIK